MDGRGYRLGVDFGTSNTVAMLEWPDGQIRPLLFDGSPSMPSAVCWDPSGGLLVGRDALHAARATPERFEPNPKRRIDEPSILLGEAEVPIVDLIGSVLSRVATEARRVAGGAVGAVTVTYPAAWGQTRRGILASAAERAGLTPTVLVPEPVAAASSFLAAADRLVPIGAGVVIYDLGAGTFDASVVRRSPGGFDVLASEGLSQSGGLDIDAAVVGYLGAVYSARDPQLWGRLMRPTTTAERRANRLLWEDVRVAKEMLSRTSSTMINIPLADDDAPLGRDQFEQLARPILDGTITATRAALGAAGIAARDVAGVFLVGGGSRIPMVATLLHQALGREPTVVEQPELVVAQGCLRAAGTLAPAYGQGSSAEQLRPVSAPPDRNQSFPPPTPPATPPRPPVPTRGVASVPTGPPRDAVVSAPPAPPAAAPPAGGPATPATPTGWPVSAPPDGASQTSGPPWTAASVSAPPAPAGYGPPPGPLPLSSPRSPAPPQPPPRHPSSQQPPPQWPTSQSSSPSGSRNWWKPVAVLLAVLLIALLAFPVIRRLFPDPPGGGQGDETETTQPPTDAAAASTAADVNWTTNASEYAGHIGLRIAYECPGDGSPGSVWGTDLYTGDSSVCTAAVHAGKITLEDGGSVVIEMKNGADAYEGSERNGIVSSSWEAFESSYEFVS